MPCPYPRTSCTPHETPCTRSKQGMFIMSKIVKDIRVILLLNGTFFCQELVPYDFPMVVLHTESRISFTCGACSEGVFEFEWKATSVGLLRAKLMLAPLDMLKRVSPSRNQYRMFFVQTSTLPPSMHQKLTKHGRSCMQNNQS